MPKNTKEKMVEKIKIEQPEENESMLSMIIGTVLVALGILLFVIGIVMFVLYYLPPREDTKMAKPVLYELPKATNRTSVAISGEAETEKVMLWINDELVNAGLKVEDGKFSYDYLVSKEGEYKVEAASLKGFPIRLRSEKTSPVVVAIDWSAPSKSVAFVYQKEVDTKTFNISGTIDSNTKITLKSGNNEYFAKSDKNGKFYIKNIPLKIGGNEFAVILTDDAGNSTRVDQSVKVIYAVGSINGNGAKVLPQSAGPLSNEMAYNLGNTLLGIIGLVSLSILGTNLYFVKRKLNQ